MLRKSPAVPVSNLPWRHSAEIHNTALSLVGTGYPAEAAFRRARWR